MPRGFRRHNLLNQIPVTPARTVVREAFDRIAKSGRDLFRVVLAPAVRSRWWAVGCTLFCLTDGSPISGQPLVTNAKAVAPALRITG